MARIYPAIGFATIRGAGAARVAVLIDDPADPDQAPDPVLLSSLFGLSEAEIAVARLVPVLPSRSAIAEAIGLSENTVKTHLSSIRDKVGARSTADLTRILVRASSAGRR
jgi:DNA-binding CsgD family transcriptional regulator